MHADLETIDVEANGLRFTCLAAGEGPLVLFLHGFPDRAESWRPILEGVAAAGFRAVAPAMRGYHPTDIPADGDYRVATLGRDALGLIEALGAERAVVVGHDWGASAAYAAAGLGPEQVSGLVTLAIPHPRLLKPSLGLLNRARHFVVFLIPGFGRWYAARRNMAYVAYLIRYWSPTWPDPEPLIAAVKADFALPGRLQAALSYYRQIPEANKRTEDNRKIRQPVQMPAMVFVGEDDGALRFDEDFANLESAYASSVEVVHVPGAGHFIPAEKPDAVLERLLPFLAAHAR